MALQGGLLIEGMGDYHVIKHLLSAMDVESNLFYKDFFGVDSLLQSLPQVLILGEFPGHHSIDKLGIIVDANSNRDKRWIDIKQILIDHGYTVDDDLPSDGLVKCDATKDISKVGVWLMPDNLSAGMIEDFFKRFIPEDDQLRNEVSTFIDSLPEEPSPRSKAEVRTWLACQKKSESLMGYFISKNKEHLNINNDLANTFVDWLKKVFSE